MGTTIEFGLNFRTKRFNDAAKGLKALGKELKADWNNAPVALGEELKEFLKSVAEAIASRHGKPWPSGTTEKTLSKRSGGLIASILGSVRVDGTTFDNLTGYIGAAFPAQVHEYGATIRPKKANFLTVPLPAALDSRGVPLKRSAREWDNTFVAKSKAGNLIIFQRRGSQIVPLYVLKTEVTIPPRLGMQETLTVGIPYFVEKAADAIVKSMLKEIA